MPKLSSLLLGKWLRSSSVLGALVLFFGLHSGAAVAQETSTLCHFNSGPRAGQNQDYAIAKIGVVSWNLIARSTLSRTPYANSRS